MNACSILLFFPPTVANAPILILSQGPQDNSKVICRTYHGPHTMKDNHSKFVSLQQM